MCNTGGQVELVDGAMRDNPIKVARSIQRYEIGLCLDLHS